MTYKTHSFGILFSKAARVLIVAFFSVLIFFTNYQSAYGAEKNWHINDYKASLSHIERSPELVARIDKAIANLPRGAKLKTEIDLHLWKLVVLAKLQETEMALGSESAGQVAAEIFDKYDREMYDSERHYGRTMYQVVESLVKTDQRDLSYDIIQHLRESVYDNPSDYLSYTIDRCLIEVYIETYDYKRALNVALSVLNNPNYRQVINERNYRTSLLNEIGFLYNRLGDGKNALTYLIHASQSFESQDLTPAQLLKVHTRSSGNRARSYLLLGEYEKAEKLAQVALEGGLELGEDYMIALGYRLTGSAAYHLGKYEKANIALEKGIKLAEKHNLIVMKKVLFLSLIHI